jgi:hypothetical protein
MVSVRYVIPTGFVVQLFVLRCAAQPASGLPVGIHLFPVTAARHRAGTARVLLADFRHPCAAAFSFCLLMLQKWIVR